MTGLESVIVTAPLHSRSLAGLVRVFHSLNSLSDFRLSSGARATRSAASGCTASLAEEAKGEGSITEMSKRTI